MTRHREEHLQRLREGLRREDPSYFRMVLKETMRLFPPVSTWMPRRSKIDTCIGDTVIPANSLVMIWPVLLVKDQEFRPSRWADDPSIVDTVLDEDNFYAPFSLGARACLAPQFFTSMLEETISGVLMQFDFELAEEDPWKGKPTVLQHFGDNLIGFKPAKNLLFHATKAAQNTDS